MEEDGSPPRREDVRPVSQWCATPSFTYLTVGVSGEPNEAYEITGHGVCSTKRWHSPDHFECCFSYEETESWGCECSCHESERRATPERIAELRANPEFQVRLAKAIERNRRALERLAE